MMIFCLFQKTKFFLVDMNPESEQLYADGIVTLSKS